MTVTPENTTATDAPEAEGRATRKIWWIVGGTFTGALLLFAMTIAGVWLWTASSPEEKRTHTEEYPQTVSGVDVDVEIGLIELSAADGDVLEVRRDTGWRGAEPETSEGWRGDTFTAEGECDDRPLFWINIDECRVDYIMHLPAGTDAEANIDVGDIRLNGLDGEIDAETSVGAVDGEELRATSTSVETGVGSVRLAYDQVLGDISIDIGTGDAELILPDDGTTYDVRFNSGVGSQDIDIATDPSTKADYTITVSIGVGDLTVRYGA